MTAEMENHFLQFWSELRSQLLTDSLNRISINKQPSYNYDYHITALQYQLERFLYNQTKHGINQLSNLNELNTEGYSIIWKGYDTTTNETIKLIAEMWWWLDLN